MGERVTSSSKAGMKLDTNGCCFLCLQVVDFKNEEGGMAMDNDQDCSSTATTTTARKEVVSLRSLRRYLKIDTDKLPGSGMSGSHSSSSLFKALSLKKEEEIKVDLCRSCARIVSKFSSVFSTLEMIQVEINYWLEKIHQRIPDGFESDSAEAEVVQNYNRRRMTLTSFKNSEAFAFVDELRKEILTKCSKLKTNLKARVELIRPSEESEDEFDGEEEHIDYIPSSPETEDPIVTATATVTVLEESLKKEEKINNGKSDYCTFNSNTGKYNCNANASCSKEFLSRSGALEHYRSIHLKKKYKCELCKVSCNRPSNLSAHKKKIHGITVSTKKAVKKYIRDPETGKYKCSKCPKEYSSSQCVYSHYRSNHNHAGGKTFPCDICNVKVLKNKENLKIHQKICRELIQKRLAEEERKEKDPNYKYPCPKCGKKFQRKGNLTTHLSSVHHHQNPANDKMPAKYKCDFCQKEFNLKSVLKQHKEILHLGKRWSCKICNKKYRSATAYRKHEKECVKKNPNHPSLSQEDETNDNDNDKLQNINAYVRNSETGNFDCSSCHRTFQTVNNARRHYRLEHLERRREYLCDRCGKSFSHNYSLNQHKRSCRGKGRRRRTTPKTREALLELEAQNQKRLDNLKKRENDPSRYKFPCHTCGLRYTRLHNLQQHKRAVHQNMKDFKCEICNKEFTYGCTLWLHKQVIHFGKLYLCKFCKKEYKSRRGRKDHEENCERRKVDEGNEMK